VISLLQGRTGLANLLGLNVTEGSASKHCYDR
jgi:hypothetical protein